MKSISGEALKAMPKELEEKEARLNQKADELQSQEVKLKAIELDLQKEAKNIDQEVEKRVAVKAAELEEQENKLKSIQDELKKEAASIDKKMKELKKTLGVKDSHETFLKLYNNVAEITSCWVAERGNTDGLLSAIQKLIEARELMISIHQE